MSLDIDKRITVVCMWMEHANQHDLPPLSVHPECGCGVYAVPQGFDLFKLKGQIGASFTIDMTNDMAKHLVMAMISELEYTFANLAVNGILGDGRIVPIKQDKIKGLNPDTPPPGKDQLPKPSELGDAIQNLEDFLNNQGEK